MRQKPFLKWAGGKYRLLASILELLPQGGRLVEPFAGSAAVYLNAAFPDALICDANADLVRLYTSLREQGEEFIRLCADFFLPENNCPERYYRLRADFNAEQDPARRAALFLYLNRHGYNGLVRYNARGGFNVPFGRYVKPYFPLREMRAFYRKSRECKTEFLARDFRGVFERLRPGDVVYCDPPYLPLQSSTVFTCYAGKVFSMEDQADLARLARLAGERGLTVVISNHDTPLARELYAGASIHCLNVRRFINCKGAGRREVAELLAVYR